MVDHRLLACFLLAFTSHWLDVLGQVKNDTKMSLGPRVIGGNIITNKELGGYLVALRFKNDFVCGGSLIEDLIVLTAAHCFENRLNKMDWVVDGGISRLSEIGTRRRIKKLVRPEVFKMATMNMDVAVLLLDKPMVGKDIGKVSLCEDHLAIGQNLVVAGFGMIEPSGKGPDQFLRAATVPVISKSYCRSSYNQSTLITDSMMCASVLGKRDACTYDSGGPLTFNKQICGIVSFGIGCASDIFPGVYTDVAYVKPFILKSIKALMSTP